MSTIFGKIIAGEIPCDKVFENDNILAFKDINPIAPVHILIVPKKEIESLQATQEGDMPLLVEIAKVAKDLANEFGIDKSGYRFLTNSGSESGQEVMHLHFHLIGGRHLGAMG